MALCSKPDIMILDEPVDGLDPVMRKNIWSFIMREVFDRQMTVLVSSHNLRELEDVCDHVGMVHKGQIVLEKALDDVKGSVHKVQTAFSTSFPEELSEKLDILSESRFGSVMTLIVRGNEEEIKSEIGKYSPLILDTLPLTLEEVFIYELGGLGYEF